MTGSLLAVTSDKTQLSDLGSYEHGIVLQGDEIVIIENQTLHLQGDIIVKDEATLIIRNSRIIWELTHFVSYIGHVTDNGKLIVENSALEVGIPINANLHVNGGKNASMIIKNSRCTWDILVSRGSLRVISSSIVGANGIFFFGQSSSHVTIRDSQVRWMVIKIAGEREEIRINGMKPGKIEHLSLKTLEGAKLDIANSSVSGWVVDIDFYDDPNKYNEKHVILENSELASLWLWFRPGSYVKISNWGAGHYRYWNLKDSSILNNIKYDLTLINTTIIEFVKLQVLGRAEFDNMKYIQVSSWGNADVFVNNSIISAGILLRGSNDSVKIWNSKVISGDLIMMNASHLAGFGGDFHHLEFKNTQIYNLNEIEMATNYSVIKGDVKLESNFERVLRWPYGRVLREFTIIVRDENGKPIPRARVYLLDPEGKLISSKLTDNDGQVKFSIIFNSENYNQIWTLEIVKIPLSVTEEVRFLSSTPITVILKERNATAYKTTTAYVYKTLTKKVTLTSTITKTLAVPTMVTLKKTVTSTYTVTMVMVRPTVGNIAAIIASISTSSIIIVVAVLIFLKRIWRAREPPRESSSQQFHQTSL